MSKVGIFYGSSTGVTKSAADAIAKELKKNSIDADVQSAGDTDISTITSYSGIILGTSTWGMGDLQDDWEGLRKPLANSDLSGKTVALFGSGDQDGYPDTFVDGIGILYDAVSSAGANVVGSVSTNGYNYDASLAERDGEFVGLPIDEDNQADMTDKRIKAWVASICESFAG